MAKLTTGTLGQAPISKSIAGQESQTSYPSMQVQNKTSLSQHAKCRQANPVCIAKGHYIKGAARALNSKIAVGVRRAHYKKTGRAGAEPATTTLWEARQGTRHEA